MSRSISKTFCGNEVARLPGLSMHPLVSLRSQRRPFFGRHLGACLVLVASALVVTGVSAGAPGAAELRWHESTPMPGPRDGYAAGVIGGELIIIGGTYWDGEAGHWTHKRFSAAAHAFNPVTKVWRALPDAPVTLGYPASAQVGEVIYVIGGLQDEIPGREVFTLQKTGTEFRWRRHSRLPESRLFANAVTIGHRLFVVGGTRDYEPFDERGTCCTSHTARKTLWELDTDAASPVWQDRPGYPGDPRWLHMAAAEGDAIYLFGGLSRPAQSAPNRMINEVLRYDVTKAEWTRLAVALPETLQVACPVAVDDNILLIGTAKTVMRFEPRTATFVPLPPFPRAVILPYVAVIDSQLVAAGGEPDGEGPRRRSDLTFIGEFGDRRKTEKSEGAQ
ncbi:MAG: hypothetical protein JWM32_2423 [Verrucomicrobia bacterium]|nr:hypothetical protein [Verrucomicrobiota bacterium]